MGATGPREFEFDWLKQGVVEWIGRNYGATGASWRNPHDSENVRVTCSSLSRGRPSELVDRSHGTQTLVTRDIPGSWIQIELPVAVRPTHYRFYHSSDAGNRHYLRDWSLVGSLDGVTWRSLCIHSKDTTISEKDLVGAWRVRTPETEWYPYFRIVGHPGGNAAGSSVVSAGCFELYGEVRHRHWPEPTKSKLGLTE
eukprot:Hpha_TRINITY_DN15720_c0_g7::TRINITY_DN15720_c0_g7_i2::g.39767::m.39767